MFTGIIEEMAEVNNRTGAGLTIGRPPNFDDIQIGSSICVSGACLSVVKLDERSISFDVHEETWKRTKLGSLNAGDRVNLERAMKADSRFEGHIVQGHVDGIGTLATSCDCSPGEVPASPMLAIKHHQELNHLIVEKGSIAIDGVSLTICEADDEKFSVALIPHTLVATTLGLMKMGDRVNLEADILGKYAYKNLNQIR